MLTFLFVVLCSVNLTTGQGLSLNLKKLRPECLMTMNSVAMGTILVPSYGVAQLSFQDCSPADVWVTANRVIGEYILSHVNGSITSLCDLTLLKNRR